jgi:Glu-tRNA(Gln) amidotransferase subunit E-like FAD-binding protein
MENEFKIKMGLEIHQQLESNRKLFCNCPPILRKDSPDIIIHRELHAIAGEFGEIDIAAKHEAQNRKKFIYEGYSDTNCLLEYDESPPFEIDQEALQIALHISLLLNCEIFPITQIMRKTVINGSNTSGFQRTVLIAKDGHIETKFGEVGIRGVFLEEDAARPVSAEGQSDPELVNSKIYKLDRLGIPLVEIVTEPDIKSAEQAKEVALHIGDVLRSCRVKRGIGTIRQDINVSIEGHPRIEIKGFQDPRMMIKTVELEIERQKYNLNLLSEENKELKRELKTEVRNANIDGTTSFLRPMPGAARMYPETDLPLLRIKKEIIDEAKKTLPKLRSEVRGELTKKGLHEDQAKIILKDKKLEDFESLLKIINDPRFIFKVLIEIPKEIASHEHIENIDEKLTIDIIDSIVDYVKENKIEKQDVKHIMKEIAKGKSFEDAVKLEKSDLGDVESEIIKIVKEKPGLSVGGYMGLIMAKFKGKVSGKEVNEILNKLIKV